MKKLIILQLLLAAHSSLAAEQNQAHTSEESHDVAAFIQRLDALHEDANIPGLSVAVVKDQAIVLAAGLGYADVEYGIPATAETAYDIASVAKPLTAVVVLRHLLSHTATGTPGTRFSYNPILYSWASRPIMVAADAPFSVLVERYIFMPAGRTIHLIGQRSSVLNLLRRFFQRSLIANRGRLTPA